MNFPWHENWFNDNRAVHSSSWNHFILHSILILDYGLDCASVNCSIITVSEWMLLILDRQAIAVAEFGVHHPGEGFHSPAKFLIDN